MRLLKVDSLDFEEFEGDDIPRYAILSHTWGSEEVTFKEMRRNHQDIQHKSGFRKIESFCAAANEHGYEYGWIDTCCIDKRSSAELTEAINSMYKWYRDASTCYVYLADVPHDEDPESAGSSFRKSRWFTRGWVRMGDQRVCRNLT